MYSSMYTIVKTQEICSIYNYNLWQEPLFSFGDLYIYNIPSVQEAVTRFV